MSDHNADIIRLWLWNEALSSEERPGDAVALLIDAAAFGLAEMDAHPQGAADRLAQPFETLHIAKYMGRPQ